jgi:large-conductance mechanosensitive channel|tara:strand:- start:77 stop:424 length:348 start_codon:yes stop_codon:yes gene_type:complete
MFNNSNKHNSSVKKFIIKTTIITSLIVWILGNHTSNFLKSLSDLLIDPLFSIDLNKDGIPDLKELNKYNVIIGNIKMPMGRILIEFIKLVFNILIVFFFIYIVINFTDLANNIKF